MPRRLRVAFPPQTFASLAANGGSFAITRNAALLTAVQGGNTANAAWLSGKPTMQWVQIPGTRYDQRDHTIFSTKGYDSTANGGYGQWYQGVFTYSGGALRKSDSTLLLFGGGGNTWGGNQVDGITLDADAPVWDTLVDPAPVDTPTHNVPWLSQNLTLQNNPFNADGTPICRHSYWTPTYIDSQGMFYVFGGSAPWPSDIGQWNYVQRVTVPDGTWSPGTGGSAVPHVPWTSSSSLGPLMCKHATTEAVYYLTQDSMYKYTPDAGLGTWTTLINGTMPVTDAQNASGAIDHTRNLLVRIGNWNGTATCKAFDLSSPGTIYSITLSGDSTAIANLLAKWPGSGFCYDPGLDAHLMYIADGNLYQIKYVTNTSYTVTQLTLTGTPPQVRDIGSQLVISRMQYVPRLGGVVIPAWYDENVFFVRTATTSLTVSPYTYPSTPKPFYVLGSSKHLKLEYIGGRHYKAFGDHAGWQAHVTWTGQYVDEMSTQDGRQEIGSFSLPSNTWSHDFDYYDSNPAHVQQAYPDDGFTIARGTEIWCFSTATAHNVTPDPNPAHFRLTGPTQPPGYATQLWGRLMAWQAPSGPWRDVAAMPTWIFEQGGRAWGGAYDSVTDKFYIPAISGNGLVWVVVNGSTGADETQFYGPGNPKTWGSMDLHGPGVAFDPVDRIIYGYNYHTAKLYKIAVDSIPGTPTFVADIGTAQADSGHVVSLCWHPGIRAVLISFDEHLHCYKVDTGSLTTFNRQVGATAPYDGFINGVGTYVPPSTLVYDPPTGDIVSLGGIDWDTSMSSPVFWLLHFT